MYIYIYPKKSNMWLPRLPMVRFSVPQAFSIPLRCVGEVCTQAQPFPNPFWGVPFTSIFPEARWLRTSFCSSLHQSQDVLELDGD